MRGMSGMSGMSEGDRSRRFAVVGATGQQGGATVRALLAAGVGVRGLTRDPSSPSARSLAGQGVEMVRGDAGDPSSLRAAFTGVGGAFVMTTPFGPGGTDRETEEGNALVDAVQAAGVPHLVLSSVGGAERESGVPHFESKRRVEEHVADLGLGATILRPAFFMDNLTSIMAPPVEDGTLVLRMPLPADVPLQMVAVEDIGAAAAAALLDPGRVPGGAIELAGDEVTGEQAASAFGTARGLPARYEALPVDVLPDEDSRAMFTWFTHLPAYQADIGACRRLVPDLHTLPVWLAEQG
jgi:uncharacterized protein YbjT (DUF2867 family)